MSLEIPDERWDTIGMKANQGAMAALTRALDTDVQGFVSHRVVEQHAWMWARAGVMVRAFGYLGESDQKGSIPPWFGTRAELGQLIETAHSHRLSLIADMVYNHNSGADAQEVNPITNQSRWTLFNPKSGKFARNWESFHPNKYEAWDEMTFGDMPDLSHRNPYVFNELMNLARWLIEEIGFDGFRYDFVKGFGAATIQAMQEYRYTRNGEYFAPYGVAEYWDSTSSTLKWVDMANFSNSNPVDAFDFPLREMFKAHCDQ